MIFSNKINQQDFDKQINVDFGTAVPAGQFCYDICLYDASNNISQIQTVCITVEAWGGNATIVGEWVFDRYDPADIDRETQTITCNNGQEIEVNNSNDIYSTWTFVLEEDGSYYETYDEETESLNYEETSENCSAVYSDPEKENSKYSGKWAYNQTKETLTVIDFAYENFINSSENETFTDGNLYFEGVSAQVISGELVLSDNNNDNGENYKVIFKRK